MRRLGFRHYSTFVFLRQTILSGKTYEVGDEVDKGTVRRSTLRRYHRNRRIGTATCPVTLARLKRHGIERRLEVAEPKAPETPVAEPKAPETPPTALEDDPRVEVLGGGWFNVTLTGKEVQKVQGQAKANALLIEE